MQILKQKLFSKRTLYIMCFMALNLIEFLRGGSTSGSIWYVAVNCTGIVMLVMIASAYKIREFCTVTNAIWTAVCLIFMMLIPFHWVNHIGEYLLWQVETAFFNVWWIAIFVKHLIYKIFIEKSMKIKFSVPAKIWIIMSLFMFTSISDYNIWPIWFLLMFGIFYLTDYKEEDRAHLWNGMIDGTIISFFVLQIFAYGLRPYDELRYKGFHGNSNMAALYYLIIYVMCLYKLHMLECKKAKRGPKIFYLIGAGGMLSFQLITMCRTAWIASIVVTLFYGIIVVRKLWKKKWTAVIARGMLIGVAMIVTFLPVFMTARWLPTVMQRRVWYPMEYNNETLIHQGDLPTSEKYTDLDEVLEAVFGRFSKFLTVKNPLVMTVYASEKDYVEEVEPIEFKWITDMAMQQRLTTYKAYWDDLTWYGNGKDKGYYQIAKNYHSWHAQNLWLQIAYYYGIPAGILLVALTGVLLVQDYKKMMKNRENPYAIIPFFICVIYFTFGLMEVVWNTGQLILFMMFFVHMPLNKRNLLAEKSMESEKQN